MPRDFGDADALRFLSHDAGTLVHFQITDFGALQAKNQGTDQQLVAAKNTVTIGFVMGRSRMSPITRCTQGQTVALTKRGLPSDEAEPVGASVFGPVGMAGCASQAKRITSSLLRYYGSAALVLNRELRSAKSDRGIDGLMPVDWTVWGGLTLPSGSKLRIQPFCSISVSYGKKFGERPSETGRAQVLGAGKAYTCALAAAPLN